MPAQLHLFGVRHHGPGSARAVLSALESVRPDCVLVEGPPDADAIVASAAREEMKPPVAILIYQADNPKRAVFYPFAEFSPEWCAIRWAIAQSTPVRFFDLPQSHRLVTEREDEDEDEEEPVVQEEAGGEAPASESDASASAPSSAAASACASDAEVDSLGDDPLGVLARAAGFDDGERWWEHTFEHRHNGDAEVFPAIRELMCALREGPEAPRSRHPWDKHEPLREAWMRRAIRDALRQHQTIAVICGAWHVPALGEELLTSRKKDDDATLKSLPKVKTIATWVPWTYDRLTLASGYGAGVHAPGWYEHLWQCRTDVVERWMTRVARLLRAEDIDCSSAHAIEATRLATSLSILRGRPLADLSDIADAARAVFCFDSDLGMRLIGRKLLLADRLGEVPDDTPLVPLQQDLQREQKRLRLKAEALERVIDLDLRGDTDLGRSELLHRLRILDIDWGKTEPGRAGKGTFHEVWRLRWDPVCLVRLIELGAWGNTVAAAASAFTAHLAAECNDLTQLARLLDDVMLANLPGAVESLLARIANVAAVAADVARLMDAMSPLAGALRYGNVRQTDKDMVRHAIDGILPRILVGLPGAVASLNDEASLEMVSRLERLHDAVQLIESQADTDAWIACLDQLAERDGVHGLVCGRSIRLLFDAGRLGDDVVARRLSLTLSRGSDTMQAAAWIEGFLSPSGLLLIHHPELLSILDGWVCSISAEEFNDRVPILRRTFSAFAPPERRQLGERLKDGVPRSAKQTGADDAIDPERAARVLPLLRMILGQSELSGGAQ
jgi:hypothetical protein